MLRAELLIERKLGLREIFLICADVGLAQAIVRVGQIGIQRDGAFVVGDRFGVVRLVGVEIAELKLRFGERRIERDRFLEQRFDFVQIDAGILRALSLSTCSSRSSTARGRCAAAARRNAESV